MPNKQQRNKRKKKNHKKNYKRKNYKNKNRRIIGNSQDRGVDPPGIVFLLISITMLGLWTYFVYLNSTSIILTSIFILSSCFILYAISLVLLEKDKRKDLFKAFKCLVEHPFKNLKQD